MRRILISCALLLVATSGLSANASEVLEAGRGGSARWSAPGDGSVVVYASFQTSVSKSGVSPDTGHEASIRVSREVCVNEEECDYKTWQKEMIVLDAGDVAFEQDGCTFALSWSAAEPWTEQSFYSRMSAYGGFVGQTTVLHRAADVSIASSCISEDLELDYGDLEEAATHTFVSV